MKKVTFLSEADNFLPDGLPIICIDGEDCVCTDETFAVLEKLIESTEYEVEDMSSEEFEALPSFIQDAVLEADVVPNTDEELDRLRAEMDKNLADYRVGRWYLNL